MLNYINCPNFIIWLRLLFEKSSDMSTEIICYQVCEVRNFEIYLKGATKL